jgi:N-acetyltransferase
LIWQQHPNPLRYQKEVFLNYFREGMASGGALAIYARKSGEIIGSSRYYDFDAERSQVIIGYTFISRSYWGGSFNAEIKKLMLTHAFRFVEKAIFHVGEKNIRSQMAMKKIGGLLAGQIQKKSSDGKLLNSFVYEIEKEKFFQRVQ